ncbi:MAG: PDZ domain-containing protein, partial [Phycisphaerae bacterium]|nr:PDZ domain-containing protein [Phycisphaerae bacterium]
REFSGEVRGLDPKLDLALIKIETGENLPVANLGDSDSIRVGEWVMAIGNPFGLEQTVTVGIVSAKGRVIGAGPYDDFIQTDASINPGNSGGPLFNVEGEVVGINTAIVAGGQGIGFAIPVDMAKQIIPQLRDEGHVTRGWLGVTVQALNDELADSFGLDDAHGALINEIVEGSPAEKAGLKRGDIIIEFDGKAVDELNDLPRLVAATPVDKTVKIEIYRDGKMRTVKVKIGKLDEGEKKLIAGDKEKSGALGITAANITPELKERYSLQGDEGILITRIDPEGPAAEANLRVGDLIIEADGREVTSITEFEKIVGKVPPGRVLRLLIQRQATLLYTTVTLK